MLTALESPTLVVVAPSGRFRRHSLAGPPSGRGRGDALARRPLLRHFSAANARTDNTNRVVAASWPGKIGLSLGHARPGNSASMTSLGRVVRNQPADLRKELPMCCWWWLWIVFWFWFFGSPDLCPD
jgi:hypothetical protein